MAKCLPSRHDKHKKAGLGTLDSKSKDSNVGGRAKKPGKLRAQLAWPAWQGSRPIEDCLKQKAAGP